MNIGSGLTDGRSRYPVPDSGGVPRCGGASRRSVGVRQRRVGDCPCRRIGATTPRPTCGRGVITPRPVIRWLDLPKADREDQGRRRAIAARRQRPGQLGLAGGGWCHRCRIRSMRMLVPWLPR